MSAPLAGYRDLPIEAASTQQDADGAIAIWKMPEQLTFVTRASGKMTSAHAKRIEVASLEMVRIVPRYAAFHDWEALDDYEIEARLRLIALGIRLRDAGDVHMLVRSRMILAAVQTAQAVLKTMRIYESRGAFEIALSARLRSARGAAPHGRGPA